MTQTEEAWLTTDFDGEARPRIRIIELVREYGRYEYRRITALLCQDG